MSAVLQFREYHVIESHYKFNPYSTEKVEGSYQITPEIFYNLEINPQSIDDAIIHLGIEIGDRSLEGSSFYVNAKIAGHFEMHQRAEDMKEEDILAYYKINAVAILFPYLRSIVSDISSKGSEGPIILPTMNIVSMIQENQFKENPNKFNE